MSAADTVAAAHDEPEAADERLVIDKIDDLLASYPPATTEAKEFLGAQFDAGLAWVHFPRGLRRPGPVPQAAAADPRAAAGGRRPVPGAAQPHRLRHGRADRS